MAMYLPIRNIDANENKQKKKNQDGGWGGVLVKYLIGVPLRLHHDALDHGNKQQQGISCLVSVRRLRAQTHTGLWFVGMHPRSAGCRKAKLQTLTPDAQKGGCERRAGVSQNNGAE
jgi:hypothetical protein